MSKKLRAISLFSGGGGDTLGLENAGFEVVAYSEIWEKARQTHEKNFKNSVLLGKESVKGDVTQITYDDLKKYIGKIDILFAGFPCQGFSHAGKKDINDPRNKLFWEFVRITEIIQPKWIIGENVAGLLNRKTDDKKTMIADVIVNAFESIGYKMAEPTVLKAEDFGIPQKRRRVFFVGNKSGIEFTFPKPLYDKNSYKGIKDILENTLHNTIEIDKTVVDGFDEENILHITHDLDIKSFTKNPHPFLQLRAKENKLSFGKRVSPNHIELSNVALPTKTIHCGYSFQPRLFVPIKYKNKYYAREFTINELAQIQSFPKDYEFCGTKNDIITQIGNAVPPILVTILANQIKELDKTL